MGKGQGSRHPMPDLGVFGVFGNLAGIIAVVWFFLKHIRQVSKEHSESLKQISENNRAESQSRKDEMMRHLDKSTNVIEGNSIVIGKNSAVLIQNTDVLRRIEDKR